MQGWNRKYTED